jgi:hypothetical protein
LTTLKSGDISTSNYASNISNILLININANNNTNNSNYASNISNILLININSNNNINNSSYASNISNILTIRDATNLTTALTNNSDYASNISNILLTNISTIGTAANDTRYLKLDGTNSMIGKLGIGNTSPQLNLDVGSTNANQNIGRSILTIGNIHNADKLDYLSIGRWDGSSAADWQFSGVKYGVITGAAAGEAANNHTCMTFHTWGNNIWNSQEVMRLTSRGRLGINTTSPAELLNMSMVILNVLEVLQMVLVVI